MKLARRAVLALLALVGLGALWLSLVFWASRPAVGGHVALRGIQNDVFVRFDDLGIPSIRASSREDAWQALGYITARDRLFHMDLMRRLMAGRLAEILGPDLVETDSEQRRLGFARVAELALSRLPAAQRAVLDAYVRGVNQYMREAAWLAPEFHLLAYQPEPWHARDSLLIVLSMFQSLSGSEEQERTRTILAHSLPRSVADFLLDDIDDYTAALLGSEAAQRPSLPRSELIRVADASRGRISSGVLSARAGEAPIGSNGWAISGTRTRHGRAMLANDMHLDLSVPNVWYRAELRYGDVFLTGVMLPGVPAIVVGSNGHVAWGLTSLEGDSLDLVRLQEESGRYRTPDGYRDLGQVHHTIAVRGASDVELMVETTVWGPVASRKLLGGKVAVRWAALDPTALDLGVLDMDRVHDVESAIAVFGAAGMPPTNVILADAQGHIAWTVTGRIPKRRGFDGAASVSWADGTAGWGGYLAPAELPRVIDPPSGMVVNANQRMLSPQQGPLLGHDFGHGYRAYRIAERLRAQPKLGEGDMLALQLDTRSALFASYRDVALEAASVPDARSRQPLQQALRALRAWDGKADASSKGFAVIARFRRLLIDEVFGAWLARCKKVEPDFRLDLADLDTPLSRALSERSLELIGARAQSWSHFLADVLEQVARELHEKYGVESLAELRWGEVNRVEIHHPLGFLPGLSWLNMSDAPLSGCGFCVRMAADQMGASQRLVVAPGREQHGILHMPAGQSGHPLSRNYRDQQQAWLGGTPLPLLAGRAAEHLTFVPASQH